MHRPRTLVTTFALAFVVVALAGCVTHVTERVPSAPCGVAPCAPCAPAQPCSPCTVVTRPCSPCAPMAMPMGEPSGDALMRAPTMFIPAGFMVFDVDGRYWVFKDPSDALAAFRDVGEPAERVTKVGVGPQGRTLMSDDAAVIDDYLKALDPSVFELPAVDLAPEVVEEMVIEEVIEDVIEDMPIEDMPIEDLVEDVDEMMPEEIVEEAPEAPAAE